MSNYYQEYIICLKYTHYSLAILITLLQGVCLWISNQVATSHDLFAPPMVHGTFINMAYYDPIFHSCCTATQLYPMLRYGGQALMHGRRSTGRRFRECFWRLSSFFCDRAETLVALLIALAIVLAFDYWPGRVIGDHFTLECKASTIYKTGI